MNARPAAANLLLALASAAVTLLVLEGSARLARRQEQREDGGLYLYVEHDPLLGWRKRPGARATFTQPEFTAEVAVNSRGLRDPERGYEAPPGAARLLALGDSFVEAYSVKAEESVTRVLERSLGRGPCRVEVVNGGTAGYSTDQEYLFYRTEGVKYSPEVVLLFFYFNDVIFNARDRYFMLYDRKPLFVVRGAGLELIQVPVPYRPRPPLPEAPRPRPDESRSALLAWVRDRLARGAPRAHDAAARVGLWPAIKRVPTRVELKVYMRKPVPEIEDAWGRTARILEALAREVAGRGSRFVVVYVPDRLEVSDRDWEVTRSRYGWEEAGMDRRKVAERLAAIGRSVGFPVLDLTPAMRAADGFFRGAYHRIDPHWNALGHRIAAGEVERFLRSRGFVPSCSTEGMNR